MDNKARGHPMRWLVLFIILAVIAWMLYSGFFKDPVGVLKGLLGSSPAE
ncbi:MAG: hypothetical protein V1735_05495 [Nanoarchaeota archaeon]